MPKVLHQPETLSKEIRHVIQALYHGKSSVFYRACLEEDMSRYTFDTAMAGRPVDADVVDKIIAAHDEDVERAFRLLEECQVPAEHVEYIKKNYID